MYEQYEESRGDDMILSVGMLVCDTFLRPVPKHILELDCAEIEPPERCQGGDALNVAQALAKLGLEVSAAGRVGRDPDGDFIEERCRALGIGTQGLIRDDRHRTAVTYVLVEQSGDRHFLSNIDIFDALSASDVKKELIGAADIVYLGSAGAMKQMDGGGAAVLFKEAKKNGALTAMDAAMNQRNRSDNWIERLKETLAYTDYFFPSMEEARAMTGKTKAEEIAKCFACFPLRGFGIKLGAEGAYATDFHDEKYIPAFRVKAVDTTGAGDTFMAGLLTGLTKEMDFFESAAFASSVAATSVAQKGSTAGVCSFEEEFQKYRQRCKERQKPVICG